ncbi:DUF2075 domain-containing protein [Treponema pedis]|uniref:DUF2075 domain-containing protein n=1 Tax=Treponema pedis TaxID=409322 RepID=UPI0003F653A4|nr:DUF2075 domain-containing protein [Treponema pedis]
MRRCYYCDSIDSFINQSKEEILGEIVKNNEFPLGDQQKLSWITQIELLHKLLANIRGSILFEFSIPRMGRRVDCIILSYGCIFVIEFKVGSEVFHNSGIDQVVDYALDLKNFHEGSHRRKIIPILIATEAKRCKLEIKFDKDFVANSICLQPEKLPAVITLVGKNYSEVEISLEDWVNAQYKPTPTIIEAAQALYQGHKVEEISRSDSGAINLSKTANAIHQIIQNVKSSNSKAICFLTGVPGAGKTLAGLNLANSWHNSDETEHAVFLSGNGPLVDVLREALARNEVSASKTKGEKIKKTAILSKTKAFIQNIHHFRDDAIESTNPPIEKIVVFDEAQRAWTLEQTSKFMKTKKGKAHFNQSEPEFLIGVMNRHKGWAVIICLIGGGQEINTGEAGIQEWLRAISKSYSNWDVYVSNKLTDSEYTQGNDILCNITSNKLYINNDLHLSVSIRSFRSEKVAAFVKSMLDNDYAMSQKHYETISKTYPFVMSRNINAAKRWIKKQARGTERYGIVASSGAVRLKSIGYNVRASINPVYWFLNPKDDVRSSFYLEDVATEFDVQGLELDWVCLIWDADLRYMAGDWELKYFKGSSWQEVNSTEARQYLKNAYRVLLTRARQGIIIVIPEGDDEDYTRLSSFYDGTYEYFKKIGIQEIT